MATRLFEDRDHASVYQKYRFSPQENLQNIIFSYLEQKLGSFHLAVDVGCGSGQSAQILAKRFEKVVGTDVSEAQIEEARRSPHPPNVSYLVCPAEDLPFEDSSVDLLTAFAAVHWFDTDRFMRELDRVLKPSGCAVFSSYNQRMQVCYLDRTERLTQIFLEVMERLFVYRDDKITRVLNDYQEIFDSLPYPEKERITDIVDKIPMTVAGLMGYIQSLSMYQTLQKVDSEAALSLMQNTEQRILEAMGVSSRETIIELQATFVCILGHKNH